MGQTMFKNLQAQLHGKYVHNPRVHILSRVLARLIPQKGKVLDIGCGDGWLAKLIVDRRSDIAINGIDVLVRERTHIPVKRFDGKVIPYENASFDVVMFVDVLHHLDNPIILLREAVRVARKSLVIKDHTLNGFLAGPTLRFMDWVSNAPHGVALPYNYWREETWREAISTLGLTISAWKKKLRLYPRPADWIFGRSLHFVAKLDVTQPVAV